MIKVQFIKLALSIVPLLLTGVTVTAAPASANALPFSAIGDVAAAEGPGFGATRIYSQNANGDIVQTCVHGPFNKGSTTGTDCGKNFENFIIVPANETIWGTPIAAAGLGETSDSTVYLFFYTPDNTIGEYIINAGQNTFVGGTSCGRCVTKEKLAIANGTSALYAIGSTNATHTLRVGFISAGSPDTLTEAIWDSTDNHWSTAGLPDQ